MRVSIESRVAAPPTQVWDRVTSTSGIDHELRPWLTMRMPARWRGHRLSEVPVGQPLGRAWLLLFGVLPCEYDDLVLTEVEPGQWFQERSTMLLMRAWGHRRTLVAADPGQTSVRDEVNFELRSPLRWSSPVATRIVGALFAHRHRRLRDYFS